MRSTLLFAVCVAALSLAACSDKHAAEIKEGAKAATADVKDAAHDIATDKDIKEAGTAIKDSAKDAGADLKEAAGKATDSVKEAGSDLKHGAEKAGEKTKKDVHEATK